MAISDGVARNIGKLLRNLSDPKWYAAEGAKLTTNIVVINKIGNSVNAYLRAHLYDGRQHIGDVYRCGDGHEYMDVNGQQYRYDPSSNTWQNA